MNTACNWIASTILILAVPLFLPGVSVWHVGAAIGIAIMFGGLAASLRPFLSYAGVPLNAFTLGLFSVIANSALVFWTSAVLPGFLVTGWFAAIALVVALSAADAYMSLHRAQTTRSCLWIIGMLAVSGMWAGRFLSGFTAKTKSAASRVR